MFKQSIILIFGDKFSWQLTNQIIRDWCHLAQGAFLQFKFWSEPSYKAKFNQKFACFYFVASKLAISVKSCHATSVSSTWMSVPHSAFYAVVAARQLGQVTGTGFCLDQRSLGRGGEGGGMGKETGGGGAIVGGWACGGSVHIRHVYRPSWNRQNFQLAVVNIEKSSTLR